MPGVSANCLRRIKSEYEDAVKHSVKNSCVIDLIGGDLLKWNVTFSGPVCHLFVLLIRKLASLMPLSLAQLSICEGKSVTLTIAYRAYYPLKLPEYRIRRAGKV